MNILDRLRPDLKDFVPYASARRTGSVGRIRLDANESPWPSRGGTALNRYPAPQPVELLTALAELYGVATTNVWAGRGSDEAIDLLVRAFCRAGVDNVVAATPTFGMYSIAARLQGAGFRGVPLEARDGFQVDTDRLLAAVDADTKIVVLCSPNNPTGTLNHDAIEGLARSLENRALLLVDEAYIEFAGARSAIGDLARFGNLAVLRTLSKAHALAGARIGALVAHPAVITLVNAIAAPYPLPTPSVDAALVALSRDALTAADQRVGMLVDERERVCRHLALATDIDEVFPSSANFVLVRCVDASRRFGELLEAGIRVRDVSSQPGLADCLRISIGSPVENSELLAAFDIDPTEQNSMETAA